MNRTTLIITIGIIIAICTGIYLYTEWEKARFDAVLPKPPTYEEQHVADDNTRGHWHNGEWHAEPHTAPAEKPSPTEGLVKVELRQHPAEPQEQTGRPPMWLDKNGELPPEDTPRPFKHLTSLEGYDTDSLSDEDWLLFQNEFFFRMPKEWRDEHRKQRAESKKHAEFFEWYEEQFPREGAQ